MARKRKTSLPRVTLLAYRRQDLVAFVQAVENLRLLVQDLRTVAEDLKQRTKPRRRSPAAAPNGSHPEPVKGGA